jgi:hypothetical protein
MILLLVINLGSQGFFFLKACAAQGYETGVGKRYLDLLEGLAIQVAT